MKKSNSIRSGIPPLFFTVSANGSSFAVQDGDDQSPATISSVVSSNDLSESQILQTENSVSVNMPHVDLETEGLQPLAGVSFTINNTDSILNTHHGVTQLESRTVDSVYVQMTGAGVQITSMIDDEESENTFSYTFDPPEQTQIVENDPGFQLVDGETIHGTVFKNNAIDSEGNELPTGYSWSGHKFAS